jgi:hypothetical protein
VAASSAKVDKWLQERTNGSKNAVG